MGTNENNLQNSTVAKNKPVQFKKENMRQIMMNILIIIIGSFIFAIGVNTFMIPGNLGEGGIIGVAIILYYAFGWSTALTTFILNSLLLVLGFKYLSKRAMYYTIFTIPMTSIALWLTEGLRIDTEYILLNTVFGGLFVGIGIGLVIRIGSTTAGTTILAKIANEYLDVNVSVAMLFFDLIIITTALTVISIERVLLTVIALYIAMKAMDFIIEGMNPKKAVTIITSKPKELGEMINSDIRRGVTIMNGRGFYTQEDKDILYVVINKNQLTRMKRLIKSYDENAFVVVHDVNSVLGNYFI